SLIKMEFMADFTEGMSRDIARQIIKGKRTKRNRPTSPFGNTGSGDDNDCFIDSSCDERKSVSTKEDEDMANCLIMLARSVSPVTEDKYSDQICQKTEKLINSRRLTEINGVDFKSGLYAYECKTCNRTFPSFQALGGHRASHKKPKVNVDEKISSSVNHNNNNNNNIQPQPQPPVMEPVKENNNDVEDDEENKASIIINNTNNVRNGPCNIKINNNNTKGGNNNKVHECSICGSEFLSGQALGGHMRKHRPIPHTGNRSTGISTTTTTDDSTADQITEKSASNMLSLDLNFPPPEVVEDHFQFTSGSQQQRMVFSAPAFVDCHY
ncbi:zinc finger protein ZAT5-like, partial [Bidens hawaiensis]|uniref:zinc finger protein ZAT5-like n=1 Tax=Bidens hawaiensis TaxID=980011 RepID=UPI00404B2017